MAVFIFYKMHCEINTLHAEIHYNRFYTSISITINIGYVHLTLFCMYIKKKFKVLIICYFNQELSNNVIYFTNIS